LIQRIRAAVAEHTPDIAGISCLEDGADQIFARAAADAGGKLEAIIPAGVLAIVILVARHDARNGSSSASQPAAAVADPSQATRTR
jgi:hypothetical protein